MSIIKKIIRTLVCIFVGSALGTLAVLHIQSRNDEKREALEKESFAENGDAGEPGWRIRYLKRVACRPVTSTEQSKDEAFLTILERRDLSALQFSNAMRYFSSEYRDSKSNRCAPADELYRRVSEASRRSPHQGNCHSEHIGPVALMPPSNWMAERLAKCAFEREPITSSSAGYDMRVQWMKALATQDRYALPWFDKAYRNISNSSALGRSAALVAVAADPKRAVSKVSDQLNLALRRAKSRKMKVLSDHGYVLAISPRDINTLEQLAYALSIAGSDADSHAAPLREMADLKFALPSPPFGLLADGLKSLCLIADRIGGETKQHIGAKQYCQAKS